MHHKVFMLFMRPTVIRHHGSPADRTSAFGRSTGMRQREPGPSPETEKVHPGPPEQLQQPALEEHASGLLDLPGALLSLIWKQLGVADRKSLCCTARSLRACEGGWTPCMPCLPGSTAWPIGFLIISGCRDQCAADRLLGQGAS
jgi:hypothetical protein